MMTVIALVAAYFGILALLFAIANPHRARLKELAADLVADYPDDDLARLFCTNYLRTAYSWRAAPIRFLAYMIALMIPGPKLEQECIEMEREHAFMADSRVRELIESYHASIAAVNPLFGALLYFAKLLIRLKAFVNHRGKMKAHEAVYVGLRGYA
ncbi:hypothetical protein KNJ79_01980 [Sphingopyxis indica]|uniref:hypothetical protein n=1 Tax=Sphingopyxis indica TaxID=436663 RepID=UPI00293911F9|nr:hypothetical protein [Sphingopyxis indica]WOF43756.1 hypothetical protein KNJ79_01980 [Sphingopyxis indica]